AADRPDLLTGPRRPPDRGPLHDGPAGSGRRLRAARRQTGAAVPLRYVSAPFGDAGRVEAARERRCDRGHPARRVVDAVRERWFGATGRRVPEIAVEGELDVEGALVLE